MALKNKVWFRKLKTVVLILLILCVYLAINYFVQFKIDLPVIDVTEQKVYTLTDISKKAIENIDIGSVNILRNSTTLDFEDYFFETDVEGDILLDETGLMLTDEYGYVLVG